MMYQIDVDGETKALVSHLSPNLKRQLKESLRGLAGDPTSGKPLQQELAGPRSYRIGKFRLIYQINSTRRRIHVIAIGPRKTVYEALTRDLVRARKAPNQNT